MHVTVAGAGGRQLSGKPSHETASDQADMHPAGETAVTTATPQHSRKALGRNTDPKSC